ncbi:putative epidermal cell surface receptor isoform X1 [Cylas formicarius]|uniref:putative epidermal cell surface receptor isoform X1 n=1 Tax=Cylas formicarius TaxID=197179 RepID=UPI0029588B64|nr:putative epidermal cell surface receptor isoform X1 [Cylas formicarius]
MTTKGYYIVVVLVYVWCVGTVTVTEIDCTGRDSSRKCDEAVKEDIDSASSSKNKEEQEMTFHTSRPVQQPKVFNMLAEDLMDSSFRPTALPHISSTLQTVTNKSATNSSKPVSIEEHRGRALNFTIEEKNNYNNLANTSNHDEPDLSDVTIHEEDDESDVINPKILTSKGIDLHNVTFVPGICEKGGLTYENGERLENGCDSVCVCENGTMECTDRCKGPFFRKGKTIEDPLCTAKDSDDHCCSVMVCAGDTETEPIEMCTYKNNTYNRGDVFNKDCLEVCTCLRGGKAHCKPRCPQTKKTSDRCVEVPDPNDSCCKQVLCDVTLDDQEHEKEDFKVKHKVISATQVNSSVIILQFEPNFEDNDSLPIIEVSNDKTNWIYYQLLPQGLLFVREKSKFLRVEGNDDIVNIVDKETPAIVFKAEKNHKKLDQESCLYKGKSFKTGEEYNDECNALCVCQKGEMKCLKLECPTYFGVEVLDPGCIDWETIPPNFKPTPPHCCPDQVRCKNNGSCLYDGVLYKNWEQLPANITGCEKRCYCEMGKLECQNICSPVPALPPPNLPCSPRDAALQHVQEDDCCKYWVCNTDHASTYNNTTNVDKNAQNKSSTHENSYLGSIIAGKESSKILGPLTVYINEDSTPTSNSVDPLDPPKKPLLSPFENPFYKNPHFNKKSQIKSQIVSKHHSNKAIQNNNDGYFGPFIKPKPNVTFNKPHNDSEDTPIIGAFPRLPPPTKIPTHSQENTDDILQIIQQHPALSSLPSGSIFEIHKVPSEPSKSHSTFSNNNKIHPSAHSSSDHVNPPVVPVLLHPSQTHVVGHEISLEQILDELHRNVNSQNVGPLVPFPHGIQYPPQIAHPSISGVRPEPTRQNTTQTEFNNHYPDDFSNGGFQQPSDEIEVHTLEALDAHTIRLAFMVPPVIVGLHGRVEVRYTHSQSDDFDSWDLQVFAPPNDLIATPSLEFDLRDLVPDREYKIKITITLRDLHNTKSSRVYKIRTPTEEETTTLPPVIPIEPDLEISDINSTWVTVVWRKFTEYELQFIDGVQLRYREVDGKIYAATPLIHRAVTTYTLEKLKPNVKYEIGIFFIPFPNQRTELNAEHMIHFTTANEVDTYGFGVTLEISQIKSTSVEISWNGVPYPEDKYVNIYRAIYQSDSGKEDHSTFKVAKRDSPTKTIITDLKPGTRYRLWLEVYLTNGKIKTSNVQDFISKPRTGPNLSSSSQHDKLSRAELVEDARGDYYGPLVIVAILAAIAILSTLILLLILVRRHNQNKAAITPPTARISQSAYDNPTYKVEIQQETMGL